MCDFVRVHSCICMRVRAYCECANEEDFYCPKGAYVPVNVEGSDSEENNLTQSLLPDLSK